MEKTFSFSSEHVFSDEEGGSMCNPTFICWVIEVDTRGIEETKQSEVGARTLADLMEHRKTRADHFGALSYKLFFDTRKQSDRRNK